MRIYNTIMFWTLAWVLIGLFYLNAKIDHTLSFPEYGIQASEYVSEYGCGMAWTYSKKRGLY